MGGTKLAAYRASKTGVLVELKEMYMQYAYRLINIRNAYICLECTSNAYIELLPAIVLIKIRLKK